MIEKYVKKRDTLWPKTHDSKVSDIGFQWKDQEQDTLRHTSHISYIITTFFFSIIIRVNSFEENLR